MIASEIFATQRTWTWAEEPRPILKTRPTGPGRLRDPIEADLPCPRWARMGKNIRQAMRSLHRPPETEFPRWYETECSHAPSAPGGGVDQSAYTREEYPYWATMSVDPAAPFMGIQRDGFVTSEMKRSDVPALWAPSARADGGPAGVDDLDTSRAQVPDPREIPRVLSQAGDRACGHGWAGDRSGEGEKGSRPRGVGRRRHNVADCSVGRLIPEPGTASAHLIVAGELRSRRHSRRCSGPRHGATPKWAENRVGSVN